MFDHVDPRVFWPCFALFWLAASWVALWLFAKLVDAGNERHKFHNQDHVAAMHRMHKANGFKSKQGIR
jgi:hypothetical protein